MSGANGSIPNVDGARIAKHNMNASKCLENKFFVLIVEPPLLKKYLKKLVQHCIKNREIETRFLRQQCIVVNQRYHRIVSLPCSGTKFRHLLFPS